MGLNDNQISPHLSHWEATPLAKAYGAQDVPNVASYLTPCRDQADADNSIRQLRANCPALFEKGRR